MRICDALELLVPAASNPALAGPDGYRGLRRSCRIGRATTGVMPSTPPRSGGELGWSPRHQFEDGLRATVQWYLEHRDWCAGVSAGRYDRERLGLRPGA